MQLSRTTAPGQSVQASPISAQSSTRAPEWTTVRAPIFALGPT